MDSRLSRGRLGHALRGGVVAVIAIVGYLSIVDPGPGVALVFGTMLVGGILYGLGYPTPETVQRTVRLYRLVVSLWTAGLLGAGGYYMAVHQVWVPGALLVSWGLLLAGGYVVTPWDEVQASIERSGEGAEAAPGSIVPDQVRSLARHVGGGAIWVTLAVLLAWVVWPPGPGWALIGLAMGLYGVLYAASSPHEGDVDRVTWVRRVRAAVPGVALVLAAVAFFVSGSPLVRVVFFGIVGLVVIYRWGTGRSTAEHRAAVLGARE